MHSIFVLCNMYKFSIRSFLRLVNQGKNCVKKKTAMDFWEKKCIIILIQNVLHGQGVSMGTARKMSFMEKLLGSINSLSSPAGE